MIERLTTEARAVLQRAGGERTTPAALAAALCGAPGNTASLWTPTPPPSSSEFAAGTESRDLLEEAMAISVQENATHVGTEHLLAALVRTGPDEVVAWLAERGATRESSDAVLAALHGTPGTERRANRRKVPLPVTIAGTVLLVAIVFVLCVWGP
jgi:ATP-dependent Clp protease ATP-binding subunit ClpA